MRLEFTIGGGTSRLLIALRDDARLEDALQLVERLASISAVPASYALVTPRGLRLRRSAPWRWHGPGVPERTVTHLRTGAVASLCAAVDALGRTVQQEAA